MRGKRLLTLVSAIVLVLILVALPLMTACAKPAPAPAPALAPAPPVEEWPKSLSIYATMPNTALTIASIEIGNIITKYAGVPTTGISTSGCTESCNAMLAGKTKMAAITTGDMAGALEGREGFQPGGPEIIRNVIAVYDAPFMILSRADSGIMKITDIKGKRAMATSGGASVIQDTMLAGVIEAYGITFDDFTATPRLMWSDQAAALKEGTTDVIMRPMRYPVGVVTDLANALPVYWIPIDKNKEISEKIGEVVPHTVPAGTYDFLKEDVPCVGFQCIITIRSDVPESLVYEITKAIYTHVDEIKASHPLWKDWSIKYSLTNPNAPYHSGVVKYYKEVGVWTPDLDKRQQEVLAKLGQTK